MTFVFDASAIYAIIESEDADLLYRGITIGLASYEIGNTLWKEHTIHKNKSYSKIMELLAAINEVIENMELYNSKETQKETLDIAAKLHISYYDASYVVAAKNTGGVLISKDKKLIAKVGEVVDAKESV